LRLWKDSLKATERDHSAYPLSYRGDEAWNKYDVVLDRQFPLQREFELAAIYDLAKGERLEIRSLSGVQAAEAVIANTYRGEYVTLAGNPRAHWEACVRLVHKTPIYSVERPWNLASGAHIAEQIVEHSVTITTHPGPGS
jgi:hypothetical protein